MTSDFDALRAAILTDPDDDTPRFELADWAGVVREAKINTKVAYNFIGRPHLY